VGGAEVSDRDANYIIADPGTSARDVLRLIDMIRSRVKEGTGIELEMEMAIWG
jgi:UDP-N-acetylmuramate dehydrogenase